MRGWVGENDAMTLAAATYKLTARKALTYASVDYAAGASITFADDRLCLRALRILQDDVDAILLSTSSTVPRHRADKDMATNVVAQQQGVADEEGVAPGGEGAQTGTAGDVVYQDGGPVRMGASVQAALDFLKRLGLVKGTIPSARIRGNVIGADTETVTIGGHVFKFMTTLVAATTYTQVKVLGSAALTLAEMIKAINGVKSSNSVQATTPFAELIVADLINTDYLRIRLADARGGNAITGAGPSITLAEASAWGPWSNTNLNASGVADALAGVARISHAVTAAEITAGAYYAELGFTPTSFVGEILASTGASPTAPRTDAITIDGNAIKVTLAGGAAPAAQAGDIVHIIAFG